MKKRLSGFTLLETIIVMAIFSMIMFSVMQLMEPVSQYFVRSSNYENSTACLDNMRRCIEGNLMYADRIRGYAGYEPYHYSDSDSDGIVTSTYAPSEALKDQVTQFYKDFFLNRVCFDATGTIYAICFDNTVIANDDALKNISMLSEYSEQRLNQGKIVLYEFPYAYESDTYTFSPDTYDVTEWTVNQKLYGNFDYTFYLGHDGKADDGTDLTAAADLVEQYVFQATDCKVHIKVTEVMRSPEGGLVRDTVGTSYQNTYASFIMENALVYGGTAFTSVAKLDEKILFDPTKVGVARFTWEKHARIEQLLKMDADEQVDYNQPTLTSSFYFIFTTPDSTENVDPMQWGGDVPVSYYSGYVPS